MAMPLEESPTLPFGRYCPLKHSRDVRHPSSIKSSSTYISAISNSHSDATSTLSYTSKELGYGAMILVTGDQSKVERKTSEGITTTTRNATAMEGQGWEMHVDHIINVFHIERDHLAKLPK